MMTMCVCVCALSLWQAAEIVAIILAYWQLILPTIRSLDVVLKESRGALLLFPDEIILAVPSLLTLMQTYTKTVRRSRSNAY